jgi:hypothetical protein
MASEHSRRLKRDQALAKFLNVKTYPATNPSVPDRAQRRARFNAFCKDTGLDRVEAKKMLREEEAKLRAQGIDPFNMPKDL